MNKLSLLRKVNFLSTCVFLLSLFFLKGLISLDPDFGWRIKAGEYYWNNGIPKTDIFSYTMPNFPWVDHAWGISLIFYLINNLLGYPVLVFLMSLLLFATILVLSKSVLKYDFSKTLHDKLIFVLHSRYFPLVLKPKLKSAFPFSFFPLILATSIFLLFFGVRAQIVSWFMFSVLVYWVFDERIFNRIKLFLPAFFLIWANLHGSFALGIVFLFLYLFFKLFKNRKVFVSDIFLGSFSFIATFINPYGMGVWREAWSSASDPKLRWSIAEWMPALTMFDLAMVFLICLSLVLIWKYKKKYTYFELFVFLFLFIQTILSRRQLPLWTIFTLPLIARGLYYFVGDLKKIKKGVLRFVNVYRVAWIISFFIFLFQSYFSLDDARAISPAKFYPVSAVNYLHENLPDGEIFSDYGWGGYLIMNLSQKQVFIDGRMPSWRWDPEGVKDLSGAFDTYNEILKGDIDYKDIFDKFNIGTVLVRKASDRPKNPFYEKVHDFLVLFGWEKNDFGLLNALEDDGWKKVYEDDVSVIYKND